MRMVCDRVCPDSADGLVPLHTGCKLIEFQGKQLCISILKLIGKECFGWVNKTKTCWGDAGRGFWCRKWILLFSGSLWEGHEDVICLNPIPAIKGHDVTSSIGILCTWDLNEKKQWRERCTYILRKPKRKFKASLHVLVYFWKKKTSKWVQSRKQSKRGGRHKRRTRTERLLQASLFLKRVL